LIFGGVNNNTNCLVLYACIVEVKPIRYTPAGLPALDLILEHESKVFEASQERQVHAAVKAVAFGSVAETLVSQAVGSIWMFSGFVATPRNSKSLVFHIQEFNQDQP
jgi:primosomal replication protein N